MKARSGFVSNSSSSSFCINLADLTLNQVKKIENHAQGDDDDEWSITQEDGVLQGYTSMDNFDMRNFLEVIKVPGEVITWD